MWESLENFEPMSVYYQDSSLSSIFKQEASTDHFTEATFLALAIAYNWRVW